MENNFKYIVYQTINILNNKIYIGYHRVTDTNKFDGYIGNGVNVYNNSSYMNPRFPFQYAVKKYGTKNFKRTILYIFKNEQEAIDKVSEIVNEEFTSRSDTYNISFGDNLTPIPVSCKVYQFNTEGKLLKEWDSIYDVANFTQIWKQSIHKAIQHKYKLYGSYWSYKPTIDVTLYTNPNRSRKVYKYNKSGVCISMYDTIEQAARCHNTTPEHIEELIESGAFTKEDYYLNHKLYDEYIQKPRTDLKNAKVYLYDLNGVFIKEQLVKDFRREYRVFSYKKLFNALLNKTPLKGLQLRLEKYDSLEPKINKRRIIVLYTVSGEIVEEFNSVSALCNKYDLDKTTVSKILRGCLKSTKGYTMKYKN